MKVSRSLGKTAKSWGSVGKVSPAPLVEFVPNLGEVFLLLQPTFPACHIEDAAEEEGRGWAEHLEKKNLISRDSL